MKKIELSSTSREDFEKACSRFSSFPGILEATTASSYESFLGKTLGYIHDVCKSGRVGDFEILALISRIAKIINGAEKVDMSVAQRERNTINQMVIDRVPNNNYSGVSEISLLNEMNVDFKPALYKFIMCCVPLSYEMFIRYILKKENILSKYPVLDLYNIHDFIDYLISYKGQNNPNINLEAKDIADVLEGIMDEERKCFSASNGRYTNKYPSLAKSLLLMETREELSRLKEEYKDDEQFASYLAMLIARLSDYDIKFLKGISVSVPFNKISGRIKEVLDTLLASNKVLIALYSKGIVEVAVSDLAEEILKTGEYDITPAELVGCVPDTYIDRMIEGYQNKDSDNSSASRLAEVMEKYCRGSDGKCSYKEAKKYLDTTYGKPSEKAV